MDFISRQIDTCGYIQKILDIESCHNLADNS